MSGKESLGRELMLISELAGMFLPRDEERGMSWTRGGGGLGMPGAYCFF